MFTSLVYCIRNHEAVANESIETETVAEDEATAEVTDGEPTRTEATEYVFTGLAWNREYTVTVVAVYGGSESEAAVATVKTGVPEILSPAVTATGTSTSAITVKWDIAEGATGYLVVCTDDPEAAEWFALETTAGDATEYVLEGRGEGETVYFRVSAVYEDCTYEPGETAKATTKVTPKATTANTGGAGAGTDTGSNVGSGDTSGNVGSGDTNGNVPTPTRYFLTSDHMFWPTYEAAQQHVTEDWASYQSDVPLKYGYMDAFSPEEAWANMVAHFGW
jgi:hypothetical protein